MRSTTPRSRAGAFVAALGAAGLAAALLAPPAAAQERGAANPRQVPNAACGQQTAQADFRDRGAAAQTHRRSIDCVAVRGIAQGSGGSYRPLETVTRGQMASFVARTLEADGKQLPAPRDQGFSDIGDSVHRDRIRQLAQIDVVQGRTADRYEPRGTVTRAQMASYLVRAASWAHGVTYAPVGDDPYFTDIGGSVHAGSIRAGYELWAFEGRGPGAYEPGTAVRRDAMATFLTRALDLLRPPDPQSTHQSYLVAPQEPYDGTPPGQQVGFEVLGRYDDERVSSSLHVALFPCNQVGTDSLPPTFRDANDDGLADGLASTDTQQAYVDGVNGRATSGRPRLVRDVPQRADGTIEVTVVSPAADCTVAVVYDDRALPDALRVDALGLVANPYGIGRASWG